VAEEVTQVSLHEEAAFQLANVTKTAPQFGAITPRWLVRFLDWKPLEAGTFRLNRSMRASRSSRPAATKTSRRWLLPLSNIRRSRGNTA
jgi:hypothetical protein